MENQEPIRCKTILVGDSGVGKTSIIGRYINKYNPYEKATIGASFTNKSEIINGKTIRFEIWDTAGQERFRSVNSIFYQDAYICILVYDITSKQSFDSLKDYWYNAVKENGITGMIFHVVGNKIDLFENEKVDKSEVKAYCDTIDAEVNYISATENQFIDELFRKLGEKFLKSDIFQNIESQSTKRKKIKINYEDEDNKETKEKKKKKCC